MPSPLRNPTTSEVQYTDEERCFMVAMETYKRLNGRPHPTCREILAVLCSLGYRLVAERTAAPVFRAYASQQKRRPRTRRGG